MPKKEKTIIATTYTYKRNEDGSLTRVGEPKSKETKYKSWGELRNDLISKSQSQKGKNVKFDRYQTINVATKPKINHYYQENKDGTFSRTYFKTKRDNVKAFNNVDLGF